MPQVMSLRESRERAERVHLLRALGLSWGAIRDAEGFTSVGGAQRACERHRARNAMPDAKTVATEIVERKRFTMSKAAVALMQTDDPHVVAELVRAMNAQDVELAKMYGLTSNAVEVNVNVRDPVTIIDNLRDELLASLEARRGTADEVMDAEAVDAEVVEIEK
ncbi:hypothetical protein EV580_0096 [Mycobacterium sp. BK086]|uniref:hypothetical protein n=1 Tax=Mycobacterium sp. BK086 TaxID=2512165 RepID=UPI00105E9529|nr:hypothetical protein [Mycobacterium sp. BK086]TDO16932.1 hypothetical protein EV580_0096 [Mycobacterium sp. BK086]